MEAIIRHILEQGFITSSVRRRLLALLKHDKITPDELRIALRDLPHSFVIPKRGDSGPPEKIRIREDHISLPTSSSLIRKAMKSGRKLILDLRNCGGGDLNVFLKGLAPVFKLNGGFTPLFKIRGRSWEICWGLDRGYRIIKKKCKALSPITLVPGLSIVCKVGHKTASSAEILVAIRRTY